MELRLQSRFDSGQGYKSMIVFPIMRVSTRNSCGIVQSAGYHALNVGIMVRVHIPQPEIERLNMSAEAMIVIAILAGVFLFLAIVSFVSRMSVAEKLWRITHPEK